MNNLTILSEFEEIINKRKYKKYVCQCTCGKIKNILKDNFLKTQSCGCIRTSDKNEYVGKKINKLTITALSTGRGRSRELKVFCYCECDPLKSLEIELCKITNQHVKSCGCLQKEIASKYKDLTNEKFGKLTVLTLEEGKRWICRCECGNTTTGVKGASLLSGHTKSCGCLQKRIENKYKNNIN